MMVKLTTAAISQITEEVQDIIDEGKKPMIRLGLSIG